MTTRLVLVCHGPTTATRRAAFPDDESIEGAPARLRIRVDLAFTGPAVCCRQTAAALGLAPRLEARLRECDYGRWRGRTLAELSDTEPDAVREWLTDPTATPHGGESTMDVLARVGGWLDELPSGRQRIAAVTHPSVIRAAIVHAIRATPESFWRIDIAPLSHTVLSGGSATWTLRSLGRVPDQS
ncbi:MAG TPA: histidine phosphatase family protein [Actinophytocola sp.]|uniref:histidine phosphatase family protein n=1 Tax=Actinophytocola sp. TaxID=1872138 RepID=UPI002DBF15AA|nr:histidine phosphatase family protein [Actinophytocola sp.]HEU5470549.1 histidine phosphatase family protein [Actinophytocola sp.]